MTTPNEWFLDDHDFLSDLGISIDEQREGYVRLRLPYDGSLANPVSGVMQGGVVATLVDHAGGAALRTRLEDPHATPHASTELNVSFVRPASRDLVVEAEVVRIGWTMGVVEVEVYSEIPDGRETVAVGRVSLHLDRE